MKNISRGICGLYLILSAILTLAGCGGGDPYGYQPPPGTTGPSISNLTLSPMSAQHDEGDGSINVDISVDFVDQDGDVNYMGASVLDSSGSLLYLRGAFLTQLAGQYSGTAQATAQINTSAQGQFTIRVWLMDETFRSSNDLEVQFSVV